MAREQWYARARAVRIEDEIARRGIKLRGGIERCGPCPKCGGEDRFSINTKKQVWNCRGCDIGGDVIELVKHLDGLDFNAAGRQLAGESNGNGHVSVAKKTVTTYEYLDETGAVRFAVDRIQFLDAVKDGKFKKSFRQKRPDPDKPGEWLWNVDGVVKVPYRLPELIEAVAANHPILIVEGETKVDALAAIGVVATCNAGGAGKWPPEFGQLYLRGANVVLCPDNDEPGFKHINDVGVSLVGVAACTRVLILPGLAAKHDVKDWLAAGGTREQLDALLENAPPWVPSEAPSSSGKERASSSEQQLIDALARLDPLAYDRRRRDAADELGIRNQTLDDAVNRRRAEREEEDGPPPLFGHWVNEPWPEPVDTAELIVSIADRIKQHIVLDNEAALAVALWILFAWSHDAAVHSPILLVTSAEANSGKTQLLNLCGYLVPRALNCTELSEATLFRGIEKWRPTLVVDEADVLLVDNEGLRSVINSGWTRGSGVPRCIGDEKVPHVFPTFGPKIVGLKGRKLPDTTISRSIIVGMKRKKSGERVEHFRSIDDLGLAALRRRALRWSIDNAPKLADAHPSMPPGFDNRLGDNWAVLLAIAELAGVGWSEPIQEAAIRMSNTDDSASIGSQLLGDIKKVFDAIAEDRIASGNLCEELLIHSPDGPWSEWKAGKPITQTQLARALKPFGIASEKIWLPSGDSLRGYMRSQFEDAWERYT